MKMSADCLSCSPELPEWRRSGRFFAIAVALHAAVLFFPVKAAFGKVDLAPAKALMVRLVSAERPTERPAPVVAPPPQARPKPRQIKEHHIKAPDIIAVSTPSPQPVAPIVPPPVAAPVAVPVMAAGNAAKAAPAAAPSVLVAARFDAAYLNNPPPSYPALSRRLGEEGKVLLKVRVGTGGQPLAVDLEKSSNFPRLDEAARRVVAHWRFVPAKRGDEPCEASVIVPIVFKLEDSAFSS